MPSSPFDWDKFLAYAQALVSSGTAEATCRIATSRAYYAAYWKGRQLLERNGVSFPGSRSHEFCWECFSGVYSRDGDQIEKLGFALRARRVHADYEDAPPLEQKSADSDVRDAADLIDALKALTAEQVRTVVKRADQILPGFG